MQHERLVYNFVSCLPHKPIAMSRLRHEHIAMMMDLFGLRALPSIDWRHTSSPYTISLKNLMRRFRSRAQFFKKFFKLFNFSRRRRRASGGGHPSMAIGRVHVFSTPRSKAGCRQGGARARRGLRKGGVKLWAFFFVNINNPSDQKSFTHAEIATPLAYFVRRP